MLKQNKCPACNTVFKNNIPDFCPSCGWECGTDITLFPTLSKPTVSELEYRRRKLAQAREHWNKTQQRIQELAKQKAEAEKQKQDSENEKVKLQKELEEGRQQKPVIPSPGVLSKAATDLVLVEGGSFLMGSDDKDSRSNEQPVHRVELSSFYLGKYPVTQRLWREIMSKNPSRFKGPTRPVDGISWHDAVEFCNRLSLREGLQPCYSLFGDADPDNWERKNLEELECDFRASGYRLPTEAEWEYAAQGGQKSKGYKFSGGYEIDRVAWYRNNSDGKTHPVGQKKANELGIYDMSGNVWEWCWDWYDEEYYAKSPATNPSGPMIWKYRLLRGGGWHSGATYCRVSYRFYDGPYNGDYVIHYGFRLCRARN